MTQVVAGATARRSLGRSDRSGNARPRRDPNILPRAAANVPERLRPTFERAAAAAVLAGAVADRDRREPEYWPAQEEPERHLRLVDPKERTPQQQRRRARLVLAGGAMLAVSVAFVLVYVHVVMAQRQFQLDKLNSQVQQQQAVYQKLRLQVAQLGSPQHIISTAEGKLGMLPPASVNYLAPSQTIPGSSSASSSSALSTVAPAGDADWPQIKSQLAGSP